MGLDGVEGFHVHVVSIQGTRSRG